MRSKIDLFRELRDNPTASVHQTHPAYDGDPPQFHLYCEGAEPERLNGRTVKSLMKEGRLAIFAVPQDSVTGFATHIEWKLQAPRY